MSILIDIVRFHFLELIMYYLLNKNKKQRLFKNYLVYKI